MTWLTPQLALIAAAIAVPSLVILYFLKLRRREVEISTTLLWKKAIQDLQANAPFQRLRRNILLVLQLLALAAALLALGQPEIKAGAPPGQRSVILIDRSASMSSADESDAGDTKLARLDKAKREALKFIDSLRDPGLLSADVLSGQKRDEAMIIAFDASAEVVQAFTADKARLRAAIESIQPSDATSSLEEAARLAGAYASPVLVEGKGLISTPGAPIYLWSDGRLPDSSRVKVNPLTPVTYTSIGKAETPNLAVTSFRAERSFDKPGHVSIFVGVQSTDTIPRSIDVEFAVDGIVSAVRAVNLPAAQSAAPRAVSGATASAVGRASTPDSATTPTNSQNTTSSSSFSSSSTGGVVFELDRAEGALMRARLIVEDALDADNQAWLVLPPARRLSVMYVAAHPTFIRDALEAQDLSRLVTASPDQFSRAIAEGTDTEFDVVILDGWAPDTDLPPGRYLIFNAIPKLEGLKRAAAPPSAPGAAPAASEPRIIIDWSREHPALRAVSMENLYISRSIPLEVGKELSVIAQSDKGPAIVEAARADVRALIVAFDVMDTNWIWDHNLVLFMGSAVHWLAGQSGGAGAGQPGVQPGATLTTRLPAQSTDVRLTLPDLTTVSLIPAADGRINFGPVRRAGLYRIQWTGAAGPDDATVGDREQRTIAANLLDPAESEIGALPALDLAARAPITSASAGGAGPAQTTRRLWPWLLLAALAVVMLEWFIYNRKVHI